MSSPAYLVLDGADTSDDDTASTATAESDKEDVVPFSWPQRAAPQPTPVNERVDTTAHVVAGIGCAVRALVLHWGVYGSTYTLFDERTLEHKLCTEQNIVDFCWTDPPNLFPADAHAALCKTAIVQMIDQMVLRTGAEAAELVFAFSLFEHAIRRRNAVFRPSNVRLLFLSCFSIAIKYSNDLNVSTNDVFKCISDIVTGIDARELARLEWGVLRIVNYSVPCSVEHYLRYLTELLAVAGYERMGAREARRALRIAIW